MFSGTHECILNNLYNLTCRITLSMCILRAATIFMIHWPQEYTSGCTVAEQKQTETLLHLMEEWYMEQIVPYPTTNENILDLVFVNNEELIYSLSVTKTSTKDLHQETGEQARNKIL